MSVNTYLRDLTSDLNVAEKEGDLINRSVSTLSNRLHYFFGSNLKEDFRFGSSVRNTMLPRRVDSTSDVDYMIVLDNDANNKPQTLITRVKNFAETYYKTTQEIYQSNPTIVLELSHIKFDLVPSFRAYSGATLQIPALASSFTDWMYTNPFSLNDSIEQANRLSGYELKPAIRLIKYWNALNDYVYKSFPLEESIINSGFGYYSDVKLCFFAIVDKLYSNRFSLPDYKRYKVERAKKVVDDVRSYESQSRPIAAEQEIAKMLPSI